MAEMFKIVVTGILIVSLAGILITIFSVAQTNDETAVLNSLGTVTVTNVTTFETFSSGTLLANGTSFLLRSTPSLTCTRVFIEGEHLNQTERHLDLVIANGNSVVAGTTEVLCSQNGTIKLFLAGNVSNGTNNPNGVFYNVSYSAKRFDASWNVTKLVQDGLLVGANNQTTLFTLILLVLVISIGLVMFGLSRSGVGEGNGFGGGSGGFKIGNPMDSFTR